MTALDPAHAILLSSPQTRSQREGRRHSLEQPMPNKRRTQPAARSKKTAAASRPKRSATTRPARSGGRVKPAKPVKKQPPRATGPARPANRARPAKPARPARLGKPAKLSKPLATRRTPPAPVPGPPSHEQAVEAFERGFQALQQRQYGKAAELLGAVVNNFSDEKDLQERARVYLAICERQAARETKPRSFEDRLHAATVIVNRGAFDEALALLRKLEHEDAGNDYVQYLLSVVCTATGNAELALAHLRKAIALSPENQLRAMQDPDLESLRHDAGFAALAGDLPRRRRPAAKKR